MSSYDLNIWQLFHRCNALLSDAPALKRGIVGTKRGTPSMSFAMPGGGLRIEDCRQLYLQAITVFTQ
jgi:hypothetical protein